MGDGRDETNVPVVFVHFSNIGLAIISNVALSGDKDHDECFFFMSFTLDTFVGIAIIWVVHREALMC